MDSKYHSFLVRLWASENHTESSWHISLESSVTGETRFFASLDELNNFFANLLGTPSASQDDTEGEHNQ